MLTSTQNIEKNPADASFPSRVGNLAWTYEQAKTFRESQPAVAPTPEEETTADVAELFNQHNKKHQ